MTLHVLNGDATRLKLERAGVEGVLTVWADALHEGPVPQGLEGDDLARVRARHFARHMDAPVGHVIEMVRSWNGALAGYRDFDEVVFWLEHDLFDQLLLIRHLYWLSTIDPGSTRFSLICIGAYPGVQNFSGLGPLTPGQLATLPAARRPITPAQVALGREAWSLFRAPDPTGLLEWMNTDLADLPFLHDALLRHLEDYPWQHDGLSRSERQILTALAQGHTTFHDIFAACQAMEERIFMGDLTLLSILRKLAGDRNPMVIVRGDGGGQNTGTIRASLTDVGAVVLDGGADYADLNSIDRWAGGVQLTSTSPWRWDSAARTLARAER